jgi:hypothetical protein
VQLVGHQDAELLQVMSRQLTQGEWQAERDRQAGKIDPVAPAPTPIEIPVAAPVASPAPYPYTVTNQNVIVANGGGRTKNTGHRTHYSIWKDAAGVEYIFLDNVRPVKLADQKGLNIIGRENVVRG